MSPESHGGSADYRKMLVKWAVEGQRRQAAKTNFSTNVKDHPNVAALLDSGATLSLAKDHLQEPLAESETTVQAPTTLGDFAAFSRTESEGDRTLRRIQAQERDTKLRDDKLLSLVELQHFNYNSSQEQEIEPSIPLTEENIEKLVQEQGGGVESFVAQTSNPPDADSSMVNRPLARPTLHETRLRDSEQTITDRTIT